MIFLTVAISLLFVQYWFRDLGKAWKKAGDLDTFLASEKFYETLWFAALVILPLLYVNFSMFGRSLDSGEETLYTTSVILSFAISLMWYQYLTWLDIFEHERLVMIFSVFLMSCATIFLVYPMTDVLEQYLNFYLNGDLFNDWWYCVIAIGLVEEIVKIIPFLIILYFTDEIDEPFDYILYGSVSALGFAFIENIQYINNSNLEAVYGRALFASVAHMFFTSIICYGMAIAKHRNYAWKDYALPIFLAIAAVAHGFYDFWLINPLANKFYLITTVFLLLSIHIWVTMKNNLINISSFFDRTVKLNSSTFKYKIILGLVAIFNLAYIAYFLLYGKSAANHFLLQSWLFNIYMVLYLAVSFENFRLIQGYIAPIHMPKNITAFLIPKIGESDNYNGETIYIQSDPKESMESETLRESLPVTGTLVRRIVFKGDTSWYVFIPNSPINAFEVVDRMFLIKIAKKGTALGKSKFTALQFLGLSHAQDFEDGTVREEDVVYLPQIWGKIVNPSVSALAQ